MKNLVFILISLFICSCSWNEDLNDYYSPKNNDRPNAYEYFWYYNHDLFYKANSCQLVGKFINNGNNLSDHYINKQYKIYNDTIYVKKRSLEPNHDIFEGIIFINDIEHFVNIKLN